MNVIILSGGSGTRLWPLSNGVRSKQFLKILRTDDGLHESMVQRTYRMIKEISKESKIVIATSEDQVASIKNQLSDTVNISIEPSRRDTFPAIVLSVAYLHDILGVSAFDSVVICPVDPLVDREYFNTIKAMYEIAGNDNLTLMGIQPTYPSEKYGYIISNLDNVLFKEKPCFNDAKKYISQGALWNGGVFACKLSYILKKAEEICGINSYIGLYSQYNKLPKISFDYAVAEHEKSIKVVKYSGEWKDLGTWNTLTEAMHDEIGGNAILGEKCENVHVVNELSIPIIGLGLKNVVIAASPDGILVSDKHSSSYLKKYVSLSRPMLEKKEWGEYRVFDYQSYSDGIKSLIKKLIVLPGKSIGYHKHFHRSEILTITNGSGIIVINGEIKELKCGDNICIAANDLHAIKAFAELHIIEVQIGDDLVENDVERYEFDWD